MLQTLEHRDMRLTASFYTLCMHCRPVSVMRPCVVTVASMPNTSDHLIWPLRRGGGGGGRKGGRRGGPEGRGVGRGARGGHGRGRGRASGGGPAALEDGADAEEHEGSDDVLHDDGGGAPLSADEALAYDLIAMHLEEEEEAV